MARINAVLLDAGGVLQLADAERIATALREVGLVVDESAVDRAHYVGIAAHDRALPTDRPAAYQAGYVSGLGFEGDEAARVDEALATLSRSGGPGARPAPGAAEAIASVVATGRPVVVVSNADGTVERRLGELGVCQVGPGPLPSVAAVIDSTVVGVEKPDVRIFELALEVVRVAPENVLHVGDSVAIDIRGAEAAGILGVHLDPFDLCTDESHPHLGALPGVVDLLDERS